MGNVEAKELIYMTHGHELRGVWWGGAGRSGIKGGKWDNCNSIINKTHLKRPAVTVTFYDYVKTAVTQYRTAWCTVTNGFMFPTFLNLNTSKFS